MVTTTFHAVFHSVRPEVPQCYWPSSQPIGVVHGCGMAAAEAHVVVNHIHPSIERDTVTVIGMHICLPLLFVLIKPLLVWLRSLYSNDRYVRILQLLLCQWNYHNTTDPTG